jgi:hypothetical protein
MKTVDIKNALVKSVAVVAIFLLSTGFTYNHTKNFTTEATINIVQENDGFTVSVKTTKEINIRFYMFTVEGRLIKELNFYGSKKISITQLEKGIYIYDFFTNDERLKNGKIELR